METPENDQITHRLAVAGYIFPKNRQEMDAFNRLYKDHLFKNNSDSINPQKILEMNTPILRKQERQQSYALNQSENYEGWRMAARGNVEIPKYLIDKMKKNQEKNDESK